MRVTNNMMINNMMRNLNNNIGRLDKYSMQMASGRRIHKPSDDPIGTSKSLKLKADLNQLNQFKSNVDEATSFLETTEMAVRSMGEALQRLRELTNQAANGVLTEEETLKIQAEVAEIKEQIISLGNTTYAGKYIFSGKKTNEPLFVFDNDENDYVYNVNLKDAEDPSIVDDKIQFEVGINEKLEINTLGFEIFDDAPNKLVNAGDDIGIINMINNIMDHLEDGNSEALSHALDDIDAYINKNLTVRSEIGAKANRMELVGKRIEDDIINFTELLTNVMYADMGEVMMNLTNEENVYRASLAAGARIIQPTLMDFLR